MSICEASMAKVFTSDSSGCRDTLCQRCFPSADALKPFLDPVVLWWCPQSSRGMCCFYDGRQSFQGPQHSSCCLLLSLEAFDSVLHRLCSSRKMSRIETKCGGVCKHADPGPGQLTREVLATGPAIKARFSRLALLFWALSQAGVCLSRRESATS